MDIYVTITKKGHVALWEEGGGNTNTGDAQVIAGSQGEPLTPIYIKRRGHLACGQHALLPVGEGVWVIRADHHRHDYEVVVAWVDGQELRSRMKKIREQGDDPTTYYYTFPLAYSFNQGEWDKEPPEFLAAAIAAAKEKAACYHCRQPHFIKSE